MAHDKHQQQLLILEALDEGRRLLVTEKHLGTFSYKLAFDILHVSINGGVYTKTNIEVNDLVNYLLNESVNTQYTIL